MKKCLKKSVEAYTILSDPDKKNQYDTFGVTTLLRNVFDFKDIFENIFLYKSMNDIFGGMFIKFS